MNKLFLKLSAVLGFVLAVCSMQAQAGSTVTLINQGGYIANLYVKLPNPGAEYIPGDTKDENGVPLRARLPVNSFVCVGITVSPWLSYSNFFFKVTEEGHYALYFTGTTLKPFYTSRYYINNSWKDEDGTGGLRKPTIFKEVRNFCS